MQGNNRNSMKKFLAHMMLISEWNHVSVMDRLKYIWNTFITIAPVAFILDVFNWWFTENKQFGTFLCFSLIINLGVGVWYHIRSRTFVFKVFLFKNFEMIFVVILGYTMLEMLRYTAGDNIAGEVFKISIQIMTLLYPISKATKNIFIITRGKYPPEFIMRKLYNFEKNGDLAKFFSAEQTEADKDFLKEFIKEKQEDLRKKEEIN